jgi:hypothetical protein
VSSLIFSTAGSSNARIRALQNLQRLDDARRRRQ